MEQQKSEQTMQIKLSVGISVHQLKRRLHSVDMPALQSYMKPSLRASKSLNQDTLLPISLQSQCCIVTIYDRLESVPA